MKCCTFSLRFQACMKKYTAAGGTSKTRYQNFTNSLLMLITNRVGAGRSAPKELKTCSNEGITKIMMMVTTTKATTITATGYIRADLILRLMPSVFSMYVANRSSSPSRMPACSPASTRLQYRESKCIGYLRNAWFKAVPVSTSLLMACSNRVIFGFSLPRATMSNDCSRGTPALIMVESCRVNSAISFGLIVLPPLARRFFILRIRMP